METAVPSAPCCLPALLRLLRTLPSVTFRKSSHPEIYSKKQTFGFESWIVNFEKYFCRA